MAEAVAEIDERGRTGDPYVRAGVASAVSGAHDDVQLITGSPPENGSHLGRLLRDGDVMEATIAGLGTQRNLTHRPTGELPHS